MIPSLLSSKTIYSPILDHLNNENFIFDIGNVLLTWNPEYIIECVLPACSNPQKYIDGIFKTKYWLDYDKGMLMDEDLINLFSKSMNLPKTVIDEILHVGRESMSPISEGFALLNTLHTKGKTLYALTDMPEKTFEYLTKKYSFWSKFSGVVVSGKVKMAKPDEKIFLHLLKKYNLEAPSVVFIDDSPHNIEAAKKLGITSILFPRDVCN